MSEYMKAVVLDKPTRGKDVVLSDMEIPCAKPGWVLVKVMAFGLNHSEQILREFEIENDYINKPIIPGIECVGEIIDPSDSALLKGQSVACLMGGMGRSFNGSYAEYALLPVSHVFPIETSLTWKEAAAVPETYFTAYGSLFECLKLTSDDKLLVRGGTCALGYAAIRLAKALGAMVVSTTHKEEKLSLLKKAGADEALIDDGSLKGKISGVTKALELIGAKTLKDTLFSVDKGALVCNTGVLGKVYAWNGFDPIKDIPNGVYLTGFYSNYPDKKTISDMFAFMDKHSIKPQIGASFKFSEIAEACEALDNGSVNGKIVVTVCENENEPVSEKADSAKNKATAYVDGSYNPADKRYSYGAVIFYNDKEEHFSESFSDEEMAAMRNVAGEIEGAMRAMRYCAENNIPELDIYYDYNGIRAWCTGEWKTNKNGTKAYKRFYDEIKDRIKINFVKVKGHSGDEYNDLADKLAREALGL